MPELPDIVVYLEALERLLGGRAIERIEVRSPFLVRSVEPDISAAAGKRISGFRRIGKRIVWQLEGELFVVFHLMIAGRFHGRAGEPCPDCGTAVQRIVYAENECNYCPRCQTGGKLLADRSLSRLLKDDWPKTIDEWELR
jgi:formamidopyrimidine-DNA glycosylase